MPTLTSGAVPPSRVHVSNLKEWGTSIGTDYWANFADLTLVPGGATDFVNYGWLEAGTFVTVKNAAADLISSADTGDTLAGVHMDTADDSVTSPFIFGDYSHALAAGAILGYTPDTLNMECYARFSATNDEETTGFGFVKHDAATVFAKTDLIAYVTTDGTNFSLESSGAAAASDGLDSTVATKFKIEMKSGTAINWYIDDTLQTNTLALLEDEFPTAFCMQAGTGGTNDPIVAWVHVWYS